MTPTFYRSVLFLLALVLVPAASVRARNQDQSTDKNRDSLAKFAGTWEGKCQDGRTFVIVDLHANGGHLDGAVSIGNMHGDDEGACMLVTQPPTAEHAQPISNAVMHGNTLSFDGAKRPNGTFNRFELKQIASNEAKLKFLETPVEKHPWQLEKLHTPE